MRDIEALFVRVIACYLERSLPDYAIFKVYDFPSRNSLKIIEAALGITNELENISVQSLSSSAETFDDLIELIISERRDKHNLVKSKFLEMSLRSAFKHFKYETLDQINDTSSLTHKMTGVHLVAPSLNPLHNYLDLLNVKLLAMSADNIQPSEATLLTHKSMAEFLSKYNAQLPKHQQGIKFTKDIQYFYETFSRQHFTWSNGLIMYCDKNQCIVYSEHENAVKYIEYDKMTKVTAQADGTIKLYRPDKKAKKGRGKMNGEDDKKRTNIDLRVGEITEIKVSVTKEEWPEMVFELFP